MDVRAEVVDILAGFALFADLTTPELETAVTNHVCDLLALMLGPTSEVLMCESELPSEWRYPASLGTIFAS